LTGKKITLRCGWFSECPGRAFLDAFVFPPRVIAICAARLRPPSWRYALQGPPNAMVPSFRNSNASSFSRPPIMLVSASARCERGKALKLFSWAIISCWNRCTARSTRRCRSSKPGIAPTISSSTERAEKFASNKLEDQEILMLSLHLLQVSLMYVNTLMIQQVLAEPEWQNRLIEVDLRALSPLRWRHVNPYGDIHPEHARASAA
jgi:Tn3 transposase DDE domain